MRHFFKPIVSSIFAVTCALSIKHFICQDLVLENIKEAQEEFVQINKDLKGIKGIAEKSGLIDEAKKDISHFVSMVKDLKRYVESGESRYSSGFDAIRGIDTSGDEDIDMEIFRESMTAQEKTPLEKVSLVHVADGDTISVIAKDGYEYRVRLIGIDTPESVNPDDSKNIEYGVRASEHTKGILEEVETLYLEYDKEHTDSYGRVLAYVWLSEDSSSLANMLNAKLLADGYAVDKVYSPNDRYAQVFRDIRLDAEKKGFGLWEYDGYKVLVGEELE